MPLLFVVLVDGPAPFTGSIHTSVADQNIDATQLRPGLGNQAFHLLPVPDVGTDQPAGATEGRDLVPGVASPARQVIDSDGSAAVLQRHLPA